jgi:hypothetical protein
MVVSSGKGNMYISFSIYVELHYIFNIKKKSNVIKLIKILRCLEKKGISFYFVLGLGGKMFHD